jgi:pterin-4a-carbinolamine dehydratase
MDEKLKKKINRLLLNTIVKTSETSGNYECVNEERAFGGTRVHGIIEDTPQDWELSNEHSKLLIKLSQQLSASELEGLEIQLLDNIKANYRKQIVDAAAYYFIHTGKLHKLVDHLKTIFTSYNDNAAFIYAVEAIGDAIRHRPDIFTEEQGEYIDDWIQDTLHGESKLTSDIQQLDTLYADPVHSLKRLKDVVNEALTQVFAKQIDTAFNPELNADEEKVHEAIDDLGLNLDLSDSLKHIANEIQSANTEHNYRDIMSAIRAYTERLYEQIAKKIDPKTKIDGKDSEKAAEYFKEQKLISGDVADLLKAHRHFLSNDGTHRIKSRKEDLRIAKNFTIELSLYLLTRLRES